MPSTHDVELARRVSSSPATASSSSSPSPSSSSFLLLPQCLTSSSSSSSSSLSNTCKIGLPLVVSQILCEVCKQLSMYSLQYFNNGEYPLPQTIIVTLAEVVKMAFVFCRLRCRFPSTTCQSLLHSLRFLTPGLLYTLNNNIYLTGLTLVPPTIWLILCSARTVITAIIYKFVLSRPVNSKQFLGVCLIVLSIILVKLPDFIAGINTLPMNAVGLAGVASVISVSAAIYSEVLFKRGSNAKGDTFMEQQFWLYFYSFVVASSMHLLSLPEYGFYQLYSDIIAIPLNLAFLLLVSIFFDSLGGLIVASILKYLDNIVKEYSASVSNILTAVFCALLFPDKFQLNVFIAFSLGSLVLGIFLYERFKSLS